MLVYALVSAKTEKAVEIFVRREDAETFLDEGEDDAQLAERLSLETLEFDA